VPAGTPFPLDTRLDHSCCRNFAAFRHSRLLDATAWRLIVTGGMWHWFDIDWPPDNSFRKKPDPKDAPARPDVPEPPVPAPPKKPTHRRVRAPPEKKSKAK
jgi:hypothetical protein